MSKLAGRQGRGVLVRRGACESADSGLARRTTTHPNGHLSPPQALLCSLRPSVHCADDWSSPLIVRSRCPALPASDSERPRQRRRLSCRPQADVDAMRTTSSRLAPDGLLEAQCQGRRAAEVVVSGSLPFGGLGRPANDRRRPSPASRAGAVVSPRAFLCLASSFADPQSTPPFAAPAAPGSWLGGLLICLVLGAATSASPGLVDARIRLTTALSPRTLPISSTFNPLPYPKPRSSATHSGRPIDGLAHPVLQPTISASAPWPAAPVPPPLLQTRARAPVLRPPSPLPLPPTPMRPAWPRPRTCTSLPRIRPGMTCCTCSPPAAPDACPSRPRPSADTPIDSSAHRPQSSRATA